MKRIKLLLIADTYQIHSRRWAECFAKRGFDVTVVSACGKLYPVTGCEVVDISGRSFVGQFLSINKLIKTIKPDILHAHTVSKRSWFAAFSGFHPFVLTAWGSDVFVDAHKNMFYEFMAKFALKRADLITSDSEALKNETIKMGGTQEKNHVVHWGIDPEIFKPGLDTSGLSEKMGLAGKKVIFSGRHFFPKYNIKTIVKALPLIVASFPEAVLILKTSGKDPVYEKEIHDLVSASGLEGSVRYVGEIEHKDMPLLYNLSSLFISVPFSDSMSISIFEAMACGCVPVAGDLASTREWVKDDVNGKLVPVSDHKALAGAVIGLLSDENKMCDIRNNNFKLCKDNFDQNRCMEEMKQYYLELLNERK